MNNQGICPITSLEHHRGVVLVASQCSRPSLRRTSTEFLVPTGEAIPAHRLRHLDIPDFVQQLVKRRPRTFIEQQVVALRHDQSRLGGNGNSTRNGVFDLAAELRGLYDTGFPLTDPLEQSNVASRVECVRCTLAFDQAQAFQG